ncbi:hypothetical protein HDU67_002849 [Dinochytrium kinnereticum]|nr:hypothetical protein HDU67_002849 [Dinochytrium kinnereticum]
MATATPFTTARAPLGPMTSTATETAAAAHTLGMPSTIFRPIGYQIPDCQDLCLRACHALSECMAICIDWALKKCWECMIALLVMASFIAVLAIPVLVLLVIGRLGVFLFRVSTNDGRFENRVRAFKDNLKAVSPSETGDAEYVLDGEHDHASSIDYDGGNVDSSARRTREKEEHSDAAVVCELGVDQESSDSNNRKIEGDGKGLDIIVKEAMYDKEAVDVGDWLGLEVQTKKANDNSLGLRVEYLSSILLACARNDILSLRNLLKPTADDVVESKTFLWISDPWEGVKGTAFDCLCIACREVILPFLVRLGFDYPSFTLITIPSPLYDQGYHDICKALLDYESPSGIAPIARRPFHELINKTGPQTSNFWGLTPLLAAVERAKGFGLISMLLEEGADVTKRDLFKRTPLTWAAYWNNKEVARKIHSAAVKTLLMRKNNAEKEFELDDMPRSGNVLTVRGMADSKDMIVIAPTASSFVEQVIIKDHPLEDYCNEALSFAIRNSSCNVYDVLIGDGIKGVGNAFIYPNLPGSFSMLQKLTLSQVRAILGNIGIKEIGFFAPFFGNLTTRMSAFLGTPYLLTFLSFLEGDLDFPIVNEFGKKASLVHYVCSPNPDFGSIVQAQRGFFSMNRSQQALHWSAVSEVLSIFRTKKLSVDDVDPETGFTPLLNAVIHHNLELVECILKAGADPNRYCRKRFNKFIPTIAKPLPTNSLLQSSPGELSFPAFVRDGDAMLSEASPDQNAKEMVTSLHLAMRAKIVEALLIFGADPTLRTPITRQTPLHMACRVSRLTVPEIDEGKSLDERATYHSFGIIKVLTSPDVPEGWRTATDWEGRTALHLAAMTSRFIGREACITLLERGVAWTIKDKDGLMAHELLLTQTVSAVNILTFLAEDAMATVTRSLPQGMEDAKGDIEIRNGKKVVRARWTVQPLMMVCARYIRREKINIDKASRRVRYLVFSSRIKKLNGSWIPPAAEGTLTGNEDAFLTSSDKRLLIETEDIDKTEIILSNINRVDLPSSPNGYPIQFNDMIGEKLTDMDDMNGHIEKPAVAEEAFSPAVLKPTVSCVEGPRLQLSSILSFQEQRSVEENPGSLGRNRGRPALQTNITNMDEQLITTSSVAKNNSPRRSPPRHFGEKPSSPTASKHPLIFGKSESKVSKVPLSTSRSIAKKKVSPFFDLFRTSRRKFTAKSSVDENGDPLVAGNGDPSLTLATILGAGEELSCGPGLDGMAYPLPNSFALEVRPLSSGPGMALFLELDELALDKIDFPLNLSRSTSMSCGGGGLLGLSKEARLSLTEEEEEMRKAFLRAALAKKMHARED